MSANQAITHVPAHELSKKLVSKEISSVELTRAFLDSIQSSNDALGSFLHVSSEAALEDARHADQLLGQKGAKDLHPLCGIPIGIKDIICTQDIPTTGASRILKDFIPPYDATVVAHIRSIGGVRIGKTNCDEFAMGSSNENSAYRPCHNPWNVQHVPGGSSGGSAAAVSARQTPISLGTDTGGSIRQPAALCGIVGLKPTYGRVSRFGSMAFASSLDQIGPMTHCTQDAALALDAISRPCSKDATYQHKPYCYNPDHLSASIKGQTLGVPWTFIQGYANEDVLENFKKQIDFYASQGVTIKTIELPHQRFASACYYILAPAEASSNLLRYDGIRYTHQTKDKESLEAIFVNSRTEGFGLEVQRRILLGTFVLSAGYFDAYYTKARKVRALIRQDFDQAFEDVDIIATPTTPTQAFALGAKTKNPMDMYHADIFTVATPLAGNPAISIPSGFTDKSLPLGLQLTAKHFDEARLFAFGSAHEQAFDHHQKVPVI